MYPTLIFKGFDLNCFIHECIPINKIGIKLFMKEKERSFFFGVSIYIIESCFNGRYVRTVCM